MLAIPAPPRGPRGVALAAHVDARAAARTRAPGHAVSAENEDGTAGEALLEAAGSRARVRGDDLLWQLSLQHGGEAPSQPVDRIALRLLSGLRIDARRKAQACAPERVGRQRSSGVASRKEAVISSLT